MFVYGTLLPGQERWPLLEPYAVGSHPASVTGQLYDTGRGYPCALFDRPGSIPGAIVELDPAQLDAALA
ncbi:MAG: gamma-glutamylcyclotransferase, partial [Kribbellaceae bacterium]